MIVKIFKNNPCPLEKCSLCYCMFMEVIGVKPYILGLLWYLRINVHQ